MRDFVQPQTLLAQHEGPERAAATGAGRCAARCSHAGARRRWRTYGKPRSPLAVRSLPTFARRQSKRSRTASPLAASTPSSATNTTVSRDGSGICPRATSQAAFRGAAKAPATAVVRRLRGSCPRAWRSSGWAELRAAADAREKLDAGATSSSFIPGSRYRGARDSSAKSSRPRRPRVGSMSGLANGSTRCCADAVHEVRLPACRPYAKRLREARPKSISARPEATPSSAGWRRSSARSAALNPGTASSSRAASR